MRRLSSKVEGDSHFFCERKTIPLNEKHISSLYSFEYEKENIRQRDSLRIGMLTIDSLLGSYTEMKD